MIKFAKLFESEKYGQILVQADDDIDSNDDGYCVYIIYYIGDLRARLTIGGMSDFSEATKNIEGITLDMVEKGISGLIWSK